MLSARVIGAAGLLLIWICAVVHAEPCQEGPKYQVGAVRQKDSLKIVQNVSIAPERFTRQDLMCLASALEKRYSSRHKEVLVSIFDDYYAATQIPAIPIEARAKDYEIYQHEHLSLIHI